MIRSCHALSISLCLALAACGNFAGDDGTEVPNADTSNQPEPNGGRGDAGGSIVTGSANVDFDLIVESTKLTLTHGLSTKLPFKIVRKGGFTDGVLVRVGGLPSGLSSAPVTVAAAKDAGELNIDVAKDLTQGAMAALTIEASSVDGRGNTSLPLEAFVRGAPGELDTTFGTNGFIDFGTTGNVNFGAAPDGRILLARGPLVRRYSSDGVQDLTFGANGDLKLGNFPSTVAFIGPNAIYWKSTFPAGGFQYVRVGKFNFEGLGDGTFGNNGIFVANPPEFTSVEAITVAPSGKLATVGSLTGNSGFRIVWITSKGAKDSLSGKAPDGYSTANVPNTLVDGAYVDDDTLVAVGTNRAIRLKQGSFDTTFGQGGIAAVAVNSVLRSIAIDGQGRYVLTGLAPSGAALYLVRLLSSGVVDPSLDGVLGGFPVVAAGGIKLDSAGRILQAGTINVDGVERCVLVRYDANGTRDASFGDNGLASPGIDGSDSKTIAVQADGRILVGGGDGSKVVRIWN